MNEFEQIFYEEPVNITCLITPDAEMGMVESASVLSNLLVNSYTQEGVRVSPPRIEDSSRAFHEILKEQRLDLVIIFSRDIDCRPDLHQYIEKLITEKHAAYVVAISQYDIDLNAKWITALQKRVHPLSNEDDDKKNIADFIFHSCINKFYYTHDFQNGPQDIMPAIAHEALEMRRWLQRHREDI